MKKVLITITLLIVGALGLWVGIEKPEPPFGSVDDGFIKYPAQVDTDLEKIEFSSRAEELLRLEHNIMGAKFRDGEITEAQWTNYLSNDFVPKSRKISGEVARVKRVLGYTTREVLEQHPELEDYKTSTKYQINTGDIVK